MTSPLRADALRNRARLVDAARELFAEDGIEGAVLNDVARRAGVGPGTLWRHFPNKEALVAEVVSESLDELAELADELRASGRAGALRIWASAVLRLIGRYHGLAATIANATGGEPLAIRCEAPEIALARLVDHAREHGEVRADVTPIDVDRLVTAVVWAAEAAGEPDVGERLLDLLFAGLAAEGGG